MAQYTLTKTDNQVTLTASGNTPEPLKLPLNIKAVTTSGALVQLGTDYFPILLDPARDTISFSSVTSAPGSKTAEVITSELNNFLFPKPAPSVAKVNGFAALGRTSGGERGQTVTVSTISALKSAAASSNPMIIKVSGILTGTGHVLLKSDKTVLGINGGTLNGIGLRVYGSSESDYVRNIIIQNLKIKNVKQVDPVTGGGYNDCIGLKYAQSIWIDHCELSADLNHSDWEYYDGLLDISKASDYITVSWTKFSDSWKGSFVGGTSDRGKDKLHVTYHHNFFLNLAERVPALMYAKAHIYNNYFLNSATKSGYAIGVRYDSIAAIENNFFENIVNPIKTNIDSIPGYISVNSGNEVKSSGNFQITTPARAMSLGYEYAMDKASLIPELVKAGAGVTLKL